MTTRAFSKISVALESYDDAPSIIIWPQSNRMIKNNLYQRFSKYISFGFLYARFEKYRLHMKAVILKRAYTTPFLVYFGIPLV